MQGKVDQQQSYLVSGVVSFIRVLHIIWDHSIKHARVMVLLPLKVTFRELPVAVTIFEKTDELMVFIVYCWLQLFVETSVFKKLEMRREYWSSFPPRFMGNGGMIFF